MSVASALNDWTVVLLFTAWITFEVTRLVGDVDELEAVLATELWSVRRLDTAMQTVTMACAGGASHPRHRSVRRATSAAGRASS